MFFIKKIDWDNVYDKAMKILQRDGEVIQSLTDSGRRMRYRDDNYLIEYNTLLDSMFIYLRKADILVFDVTGCRLGRGERNITHRRDRLWVRKFMKL